MRVRHRLSEMIGVGLRNTFRHILFTSCWIFFNNCSLRSTPPHSQTLGKGTFVFVGCQKVRTILQRRSLCSSVAAAIVGVDAMISFNNDDSGYLDWIRDNQSGYVVNHNADYLVEKLIIHRANCRTIRKTRRNL